MTIRPGDETAAGAGGRGHLRASHADREQVIGTLKAAFVQGMLAKDEFDLRVGQTFASRTYADLAALTADLPAGLAAAQPPKPAREQGEARVPRLGRVLAVATVLYAGVWPVAFALPVSGPDHDPHAGVALIVAGHLQLLVLCARVRSADSLGPAGQAFRQAATAGASAWRGRSGIPAPAISRPGWAAPAGRPGPPANRRSCAEPPSRPAIATVSRAPPRTPVRHQLQPATGTSRREESQAARSQELISMMGRASPWRRVSHPGGRCPGSVPRAGRVSRGYSALAVPMATAALRAEAAASHWSSAMRRQRTVASGSPATRVMISATRAFRSSRSALR